MNPQLERAILLFQQSRYDLAETELRQALSQDPDDAYAHALLGLCLSHRKAYQEATQETQMAIHKLPDFPFAHYAHAQVLYDRNRFSEAMPAISEAIRLNPESPEQYALLASIHLEERRWREALQAAEQGLQFDPEHIGCTNLRAVAMVKLGQRAEAGRTIDTALARNPDNSNTHANQGWTLLHQGDPKKAAEHFREALRLDPTNEWARQGIVEALKAKNIIYAWMLRYFLWMARFSRGKQWGIILAGYVGNRILGVIAQKNPALAPWILPLQILYICFALMTWLAYPFFNLLLRLNRFGRLVLSREQTVASNWFGLCLLVALASLGVCLFKGFNSPWIILALVAGMLLLPVSMIYRCHEGWPRMAMAAITIGLALLGIATALVDFIAVDSSNVGDNLLQAFLVGWVATTWGANVLALQRPRK